MEWDSIWRDGATVVGLYLYVGRGHVVTGGCPKSRQTWRGLDIPMSARSRCSDTKTPFGSHMVQSR